MSDEGQRQFFHPIPPEQSTTPGRGVTWLATAVTAAAHDLSSYKAMFGKLLELVASGGKIWVSFSDDGGTAISKSTSAGATIAAGTVEAAPIPIADGGVLTVRLDPKRHRYLHVQADSSTPTLIIRPASQSTLSQPGGNG